MLTFSSTPSLATDFCGHDLGARGDGAVMAAARLFMATEPAAHITARDQSRLAALAAAALCRLEPRLEPADLAAVAQRLTAAVGAAGAAGTDHGIAVAVSPMSCQSMLLPSAPATSIDIDIDIRPVQPAGIAHVEIGNTGPSRTYPPRRSRRWPDPGDDRPQPIDTGLLVPRAAPNDTHCNLVAAGTRPPARAGR